MTNTTAQQDRILDACREFGGKASEAVEVCEELDDIINKKNDEISALENRIGELESDLEEANNK